MGGKAPGTIGLTDLHEAARDMLGDRIPTGVRDASATGPRLLLQGVEAMRAAAMVLKSSHVYTYPGTVFGDVVLTPGTVWSGHRMLLDAGPMTVYYTVGDRLYEWRTSDFIRTEWFDAMARGGRSAHWLVTVAKVEFQFLLGLFVPAYGMALLTCAEIFEMYDKNPTEFHALYERLPRAYEKLKLLKEMFPLTYGVLMRLARESLFEHFAEGISAEDVAFWFGRLIRGFRALPEVTVRGVLWVITFTTLAVGALHAPKISVGAGAPAAEEFAKKLQQLLREKGQNLSDEEAMAVLREFTGKKGARELLEGLKADLEVIVPALQKIAKSSED